MVFTPSSPPRSFLPPHSSNPMPSLSLFRNQTGKTQNFKKYNKNKQRECTRNIHECLPEVVWKLLSWHQETHVWAKFKDQMVVMSLMERRRKHGIWYMWLGMESFSHRKKSCFPRPLCGWGVVYCFLKGSLCYGEKDTYLSSRDTEMPPRSTYKALCTWVALVLSLTTWKELYCLHLVV